MDVIFDISCLMCMVLTILGTLLFFLILSIIIMILDIAINSGRERATFIVPNKNSYAVKKEINHFFGNRSYHIEISGNQITATKGHELLMGVYTFEMTVANVPGGSMIDGEFYLQGLIPSSMKFTRYGFFGIIPRRIGYKTKNELVNTIGAREMN